MFRDDFDGAALDTSVWSVHQADSTQNASFTGVTNMLASNVEVSNGTLKLSAHRHCTDPYVNGPTGAAIASGTCSASYYSGAWVTGKTAFAPGRGAMLFLARVPTTVRGLWDSLWARNTRPWGSAYYGEPDVYENWWDLGSKGTPSDPDSFGANMNLFNAQAQLATSSAASPAFTGMVGAFHVWELDWDATATPAAFTYYYADAPGAAKSLVRTATYQAHYTSGVTVTDSDLRSIINDSGCTSGCGFRPYFDMAVVSPQDGWHAAPDESAPFVPGVMEVDAVIICAP